MKKKLGIRHAVAAAFFAASAFNGLALGVDEIEPNIPISGGAQKLTFGSEGNVTVYGAVGELRADRTPDTIDFYSFVARKGDLVEVDIDGGVKPAGTARSVDTSLYILGQGQFSPFAILIEGHVSLTQDEGTNDLRDAHIGPYLIPADGTYYIAVTGFPRIALTGGGVKNPGGDMSLSAGTYTLIVSLVPPQPQALHISMEIKPGSGLTFPPVNPKAKGSLPVALLSSDKFDALMVEPTSLTFGRTGIEESWLRCAKEGTDVNGDGLLDLVCHFDNDVADFTVDTRAAKLKGKLKGSSAAGLSASSASGASGMDIEGLADLKIRSK